MGDECARLLGGFTAGSVSRVPAASSVDAIRHGLASADFVAFHSSGTTGSSTCVVYPKATRARHTAAVLASLDLTDDLVWCALVAPGFAYGLSIVETHAAAGVGIHFVRGDGVAARLVELTETGGGGAPRPLGVYVTPQLIPVLLGAGLPPTAVRRVVVAGGCLSASAARVLATRFPGVEISNMYGQAELGPRISCWRGPAEEFVEGDVGTPLDGVTVEIAPTDTGTSAGPGSPGRILVTSELAATAIIHDPARGLEPMTFPWDTGDLGWIDEGGHLHHAGRGDHVLNVAGTRLDVEVVRRTIESELAPIAVRIAKRPARVAGDVVPVIEIVPAPDRPLTGGLVRRALHQAIGPLASLCDIRIVEHLTVGESGK